MNHWKDAPRLCGDDGLCSIFGIDDILIATVAAPLVSKLIGGNGTKKATDAATAAATANNTLARDLYDKSSSNIAPWMNRGNAGANALMGHLGLGGAGGGSGATGGATGATGFNAQAYLQAYPDVAAEYSKVNGPGIAQALGLSNDPQATMTPEQFAAWHYQSAGQNEGRQAFASTGEANGTGGTAEPAGPTMIGGQEVDQYGAVTTPRQAYTRPDAGALDVSLGSYQQSPDFQFQMDRGINALQSNKTMSGLLRSGAAMKGALDFSQNLAMGDYSQWRNYATNQYNTNRNVLNQNFESDRGYGADTYNSDRGYTTGRYDTRTGDLFNLSQQGLSGANALAGQANNYLANVSANNNSAATVAGNAALSNANSTNSLIGDGLYAFGRGSSYGGRPPPPASGGPTVFNPNSGWSS